MSKKRKPSFRKQDRHHRIRAASSLGYPNFHIRFDDGREVVVDVEKLMEERPEYFSPLKHVAGLFEDYRVDPLGIDWEYCDYPENRDKCISLEFADGRCAQFSLSGLLAYHADEAYKCELNMIGNCPFDRFGWDLTAFGYPQNDIVGWSTECIVKLDISCDLAYQKGTEVKARRRFPMKCRHGKSRK
ncbi:MAG: hypothetical protein IJ268_14050 [Proteobacteria bacterium]|nr:hypothetical protein [Pseudomonadota bacterium]